MSTVIAGLEKEHEKFRKFIALFEAELDQLEREGSMNYELVELLLDYFELFPDEWHHKKEDVVYEMLVQRVGAEAGALYDLRREHDELARSVEVFIERIERMRSGSDMPAAMLLEHGRRYASLLKAHMEKEEASFLPLAERRLNEIDWRAIEQEIANVIGPQRAQSGVGDKIARLEKDIADLRCEA
ncbi:MAG: hemerythrin domain-containing protein [Maricaulaceae bacterium]|jgi:hemerythrin-like domain-containing protein